MVTPEALKSAADCVNPTAYYKSCVCGKISTNDSDTFTSGNALARDLTHHAATAATCTQTGNREYWGCSRCNKNFSDSSGATEIDDVTIDRVPHDWSADWSNDGNNHWHGCTVCGAKNDLAAHTGNAGVCNAPQTCTQCGYQMTDALNQMLRNPIYAQADLELYEFFKGQGAVVVNEAADFAGTNGCYLYQGRDVQE